MRNKQSWCPRVSSESLWDTMKLPKGIGFTFQHSKTMVSKDVKLVEDGASTMIEEREKHVRNSYLKVKEKSDLNLQDFNQAKGASSYSDSASQRRMASPEIAGCTETSWST